MKKRIAFFLAAAMLTTAMVTAAVSLSQKEVTIQIVSPKQITVTDTLAASGTIETGAQTQVITAYPIVVKTICCKTGEAVTKGQLLYEVDINSTKAAYLSVLQGMRFDAATDRLGDVRAYLSGLPEVMRAMIAQQIPENLLILLQKVDETMTINDAFAHLDTLVPRQIYAPADGIITCQNASYTSLCGGSAPLAIISAGSNQEAVLNINQKDLKKISVGQQVTLTSDTLPSPVRLSIDRIAESASTGFSFAAAQPTVRVYLSLPHRDTFLTGATVDGKISISRPQEILTLPYEAIGQDDKGEFVYVYDQGKAVRREVETNREYADCTEISKGLKSNDQVLLWNENVLPDSRYLRLICSEQDSESD